MSFEPKNFKATEPKALPVILMLDGSSSMSSNGKIESLNKAVDTMIQKFAEEPRKDMTILVSIIIFGGKGAHVYMEYTPVQKLVAEGFVPLRAAGRTPMGAALTLAKEMIEDKNRTPSRAYRPAVILVSDGEPNDRWEEPMQAFMEGRSAKCQRFAMPIGDEANRSKAIRQFLGEEYIENLYYADEAKDIADAFSRITMSISERVCSRDPNVIAMTRAAVPAAISQQVPKPKVELMPDDLAEEF